MNLLSLKKSKPLVSIPNFRKLALSFPETSEAPHFENTAFRAVKKIFVTLNKKTNQITVKLSEVDQSVFSTFDKTVIYPVPNKWGKQGWTKVELSKIRKDMLKDILTTAYCSVAPKRLSKLFTGDDE